MFKKSVMILLSGFCLFGAMGPAYAVVFTDTYTDLEPKIFEQQGTEPLDFEMTNDTGLTWFDFHIESSWGYFDDVSYVGPGTGTFRESDFVLDITELTILDGERLDFSVGYVCDQCVITGRFTSYPTIDNGNTVPEPTTFALLGLGLAGIGYRRHRSKQAT